MSRISTIAESTATAEQLAILAAVKQSMGLVPNLVSTLAQSPAAATAYLSFSGSLAKGSLNGQIRELIALAVGEANSCDYCVSAHSLLGKHAGLAAEDVLDARRGKSNDPKLQAALSFVRKLVAERGHVSTGDVNSLREHGFSESDIVEIVANTALNIFTNYFNHVAATEIDFPLAPKLEAQG